MLIAIVFILGGFIFLTIKNNKKTHPITTKFITRSAIFTAFATILYIVPYFKFSLPFFPAFLEFHFDDVPVIIAGFAYGPLSAFFVALAKTLIKLPMTSSLGVGELVDFVLVVIAVIPASLWYKKHRSFKGAFVGSCIGFLIQLIAACFLTSFLVLDFYIFVMGFTEESIIAMCQAINPNITSLGFTYMLYIALPFNALKDVVVIILTLLLYKNTHRLIEKAVR
jgi:riboflavin transporter FmnP